MNAIASQQQLLAEALKADGWKIIDSETNLANTSFYEVWTVESLWRPVGLRAYVAFLTDGLAPSEVWAVECTSTPPLEPWTRNERIAFVRITPWNESILEFMQNLARFRDKSA